MKNWMQQFGLVFLLGFTALFGALAYSMISTGTLLDTHPLLYALRATGTGLMAIGLSLWTALRRDEAGSTGLTPLFGFLTMAGTVLLLLGLLFPSSGLSQPASMAGMGFGIASLVIAFLAQLIAPAYPSPPAKEWPATTVLTKFAVHEDEHHAQDDETDSETIAPEEDDLTRIEGIGPKLQTILYGAGIQTYALLAERDPEELKGIVKDAGFRAPFNPTSWPKQAGLAAEGNWEQLDNLQDELVAGR